MRHSMLSVSVIAMVVGLTGCAGSGGGSGGILLGRIAVTDAQRQRQEALKQPKSGKSVESMGQLTLPKNEPIRVEFKGSPILTTAWRNHLVASGYQVSEQGKPLVIQGHFQGHGKFPEKGLINTGDLSIAELVEKALVEKADQQYVAPKSSSSLYVTPTGHAASTVGLSVATTALDALVTSIGLRDAINNGVGKALGTDKDPFKFCMHGCEGDRAAWYQPTQSAAVLLTFEGQSRAVKALSYDPAFDAGEVIARAMKEAEAL